MKTVGSEIFTRPPVRTLRDLAISEGVRVLVRADLGTPIDGGGKLVDDSRLKLLVPTISALTARGAVVVVVASACGTDSGAAPPLWALSARLSELLKIDVFATQDCIGPAVEQAINEARNGSVVLLNNVRLHQGEAKNDPRFAASLAALGSVYILDSLALLASSGASVTAVPPMMAQCGVGVALERDLLGIEKILKAPRRPLCLVVGGARLSAKLSLISRLAPVVDKVLLGGGVANTFLAAQGVQMGRSLVEHELSGKAIELFGTFARRRIPAYLPVDFVVGSAHSPPGLARAVPAVELPPDMASLDIGPASIVLYRHALHLADTIVWSGPLGTNDREEFSAGTTGIVEAIATSHAQSLAFGEETIAAITAMGLGHKFTHLSFGGRITGDLLAGVPVPALTPFLTD